MDRLQLFLNFVSVAGACLCYAGCGEGAGDHCWIRSEYMIGRVSRLSRHISGVHRDTRPQFPVSGQCHTFTSDRYYWQSVTVAAPAAYYSVSRLIDSPLCSGWRNFREISQLLKFKLCVLLISKSEYWRVKNVNSWKISVGDSWIVDIYGNLKTFDGWWLKVKATLSGAVEILWNITKLLRIILTIKPKIWLTNESPEMYLTI